jgi:hypothetical protein
MILQVCVDCTHGAVKDGRSHCGREAVYGYLTNCIQKVALEDFLERNSVSEFPVEMVGNQ